MKDINIHNEGFQKVIGCIGALLQLGMTASDLAESEGTILAPIFLLSSLLFLATARFAFLGTAQATLFFGLSALLAVDGRNCFCALGFAVMGAFIVFRRGWFYINALPKAYFIAGIGCLIFIGPVVPEARPIAQAPSLICAIVYSIVVFGLAKGRFLASLAPKKSLLKLADFKLTERESQVVRNHLLGRTVKEFACDNELAESTVRNNICSAYHKLGLGSREELRALGERYRVE
jgi:DNA-binding CsgD family transcriptional regulator